MLGVAGYDKASFQNSAAFNWTNLPFYKDVALVRIKGTDISHYRYFLTFKGEVVELDGTSVPLHRPIQWDLVSLRDDNVVNYLKFYLYFLTTKRGNFRLAEVNELGELLNMQSKSEYLPKLMEKNSCTLVEKSQSYRCKVLVVYTGSLYSSEFLIKSDGFVQILEDHLLQNGTK